MRDIPPKTIEFPGVQPIDTPPARSSLPPEWLDQEGATAPTTEDHIPVAPASRVKDRALLTVLSGLNAGQVFPLQQDETNIGRSKDVHVRIDEAGISRTHGRIVRTEDGRFILEDLRSTNGIFVNGKKVERVELATSDRIQIGPNAVLRFALLDVEEEELARQLFESSTRDALTRTFNRKYLAERLAAEVAYAMRHESKLSVILFDLDHFKRVNDSHGHHAGDVVLRVVAAQVQRLIRVEDVLARYGGEEFVVIVRGIAHANAAMFAERIRRSVEQLVIPLGDLRLRASLSIGVASLSECGESSVEGLLQLADERLYKAKLSGRNRVAS
jgi:two-component system, cell cycle response regulator